MVPLPPPPFPPGHYLCHVALAAHFDAKADASLAPTIAQFLAVQGVTEVYTTGLATDFCVKFTSLDSVGSGLKTFLVEDATKGVNLSPGDVTKAIDEMVAAGVTLVNSTTILAAAAASRW